MKLKYRDFWEEFVLFKAGEFLVLLSFCLKYMIKIVKTYNKFFKPNLLYFCKDLF